MKIANNVHQENVFIFVTLGLYYNVIQERPWLKRD